MSNKLKKMNLSSVDFVVAGANQDAEFKLKKNRSNQETEKTLWEKFLTFMKGEYTDAEIDAYSINKAKQSVKDENQLYTEVLKESIDSIVQNDDLTPTEKTVMMRKSLDEFKEAFDGAIDDWSSLAKSVGDSYELSEQKGREMVIDTEKLTKEERDIYKALTRKAQVTDDDIPEEEIVDDIPEEEDVEKEDDEMDVDKCGDRFKKEDDVEVEKEDYDEADLDKCSPKVKKSIMSEMEALKKNIEALTKQKEMDEMMSVAKKYEPLGNDTQEVAETLYELKKTAPKQYDKYVRLLDENLDVVTKSGIFTEIGKSGYIGARVESTVTGKIEAKASEIMKSNPEISRFDAVEKAWQESPELAREYEADYRERR